jgi:hypothetical protein
MQQIVKRVLHCRINILSEEKREGKKKKIGKKEKL